MGWTKPGGRWCSRKGLQPSWSIWPARTCSSRRKRRRRSPTTNEVMRRSSERRCWNWAEDSESTLRRRRKMAKVAGEVRTGQQTFIPAIAEKSAAILETARSRNWRAQSREIMNAVIAQESTTTMGQGDTSATDVAISSCSELHFAQGPLLHPAGRMASNVLGRAWKTTSYGGRAERKPQACGRGNLETLKPGRGLLPSPIRLRRSWRKAIGQKRTCSTEVQARGDWGVEDGRKTVGRNCADKKRS